MGLENTILKVFIYDSKIVGLRLETWDLEAQNNEIYNFVKNYYGNIGEAAKEKNWLGFKGSYISDLFFQSIGLISFLFSFTLIFTGINIFSNKDFFLIIENTFYSILYILFGSLFFDWFNYL